MSVRGPRAPQVEPGSDIVSMRPWMLKQYGVSDAAPAEPQKVVLSDAPAAKPLADVKPAISMDIT